MRKVSYLLVVAVYVLMTSGFGRTPLVTTLSKSFFYHDQKIQFAFSITNPSLSVRTLRFSPNCNASFRIFDESLMQVYPLETQQVKCLNTTNNFVSLAPRQKISFKFELDAKYFNSQSFYLQGLVSGFRPGSMTKFQVLQRPSLYAKHYESCNSSKICEAGLSCNYGLSAYPNTGLCEVNPNIANYQSPSPSQQVLAYNQPTDTLVASPAVYPKAKADSTQAILSNLVSVSDFKKTVFNLAFVELPVENSDLILNAEQTIYLLYKHLYSKKYPSSLNGIFYLDTISSKYLDYIDASYSLGVLSQDSSYFYPRRLMTQKLLESWIHKFLGLRLSDF